MLVGNKLHPHDVTANLIYDMDFFRDLQTLEEYVWEPAKRRYQYWCYMDDLMKDAYGEI